LTAASYRPHLHAGDEANVVDGNHIGRVDHGQYQRPVPDEVHRQHLAGTAEPLREQLRRGRVRQQLAKTRHAVRALPGEGLVQFDRSNEAQLHEGLAYPSPRLALVANALRQLVLGDDLAFGKDVAQPHRLEVLRGFLHVPASDALGVCRPCHRRGILATLLDLRALLRVSAIVNTFVSRRVSKPGKETDSTALQADAWHLRMVGVRPRSLIGRHRPY
jgi:hypothetical protein